MVNKKYYLSKTLWVGFIAFIAAIIQSLFGWIIPAEVQLTILSGVMLALRFITKEEIEW